MKKILFSIVVFVVCLILIEWFLSMRVQRGYHTNHQGFDLVDSLIVYEDYTTDSAGNYVLSSIVYDSLPTTYNYSNCEFDDEKYIARVASVDGIKRIYSEFCNLKNTSASTSFQTHLIQFEQQDSLDAVDSSVLVYVQNPFNQHGFRSISFDATKTKKKKVLLIGDSFTWGMSATPYYESFADLLLAMGYAVYNTGIPSVGPVQYYHVCKTYADLIQPDIVVVNFYEGNDVLQFPRKHKAGIPHEHITNAGFFESSPEGVYLSPQDAYNFYEGSIQIPENNFFNRLLSKSAIGSIVYSVIHRNSGYSHTSQLAEEDRIALTKSYIDSISIFLTEKEYPVLFSIIPEAAAPHNENKERLDINSTLMQNIFASQVYYSPNNLYFRDYNETADIHFNNAGMKKYAVYLDSLISLELHVE